MNRKVNALIRRGVLKKVQFGRAYICSINLDSEEAQLMLSMAELHEKKRLKPKDLQIGQDTLEKIRQEFKVYSIFLSGDDLHFVLDYENDKHAILDRYPKLKKEHTQFYDKSGFKEKVLEDKEILEDHVIMYSSQKFYEMLQSFQADIFTRYNPFGMAR